MSAYPLKGIAAFCGDFDIDRRAWLHKPWRLGPGVIATNGHILIDLPGDSRMLEGVDIAPHMPAIHPKNIGSMLAGAFHAPTWQALPDLPSAVPCPLCDGVGAFADDGPECPAETCPNCYGYGEDPLAIRVGEAHFDARYLRILSTLPGIEFAPTGADKVAAFKFDGGRGLLMPMKP
jgi:hypothetical protein